MPVDSDSAIAWHRAQLKKLREILRNIETARFTVGGPPSRAGPARRRRRLPNWSRKSASRSTSSPPMNGRPGGRSRPTSEASPA